MFSALCYGPPSVLAMSPLTSNSSHRAHTHTQPSGGEVHTWPVFSIGGMDRDGHLQNYCGCEYDKIWNKKMKKSRKQVIFHVFPEYCGCQPPKTHLHQGPPTNMLPLPVMVQMPTSSIQLLPEKLFNIFFLKKSFRFCNAYRH